MKSTNETWTGKNLPAWKIYINQLIAGELSNCTRYYDQLIQWMPREEDTGLLLSLIDAKRKLIVQEKTFPGLTAEPGIRTGVLLNGTINYNLDIQLLLAQLKESLSRTSNVFLVAYNPYLSWLYRLANLIGIRKGKVPTTFITRIDLENLTRLAGYSIVRTSLIGYFPWSLLGIGDLINRFLPHIPILRWTAFAYVAILRPQVPAKQLLSVSCIIPARNERGNIESALQRMPDLGCSIEVIFVEGHSTDGTWDEIQRVMGNYRGNLKIKAIKQNGKGKADAVRLGFSEAEGDLLTILDADLTMPPEMLERFYFAYCDGHADFINGSRLVYPMEGEAMRFLNRLGNVFFAKLLTWILDVHVGDSLCGTKLLSRHDYQRMVSWRKDFGDFDPFGDFELIFPAAVLGLEIIDIPIHYHKRTYGNTNISRFSHGLMLLRMTLIGFYRIKLGFSHAHTR